MPEDGARGHLPVVAIGASAGGLEACRALLKEMPGDAPAAFVLVLHLDPTHESMMADLLAEYTPLKVVQAAHGMAMRPGCLYVIPPGVFLTVSGRVLHLSEPDGGKSVRLPFDVLLRSVARDAGALAACVVLSGTGTDGSIGLAEIAAAGGLVIAQDPGEAGYSGMPESAIATGLVAKVLRTDQMPEAIAGLWEEVSTRSGEPSEPAARRGAASVAIADRPDRPGYADVLAVVSAHAALDISLYKRGTLERRIARRMALAGLGPAETGRYLTILRADEDERAQLSADLLIHVTSFFRDKAAFDHLSAKAIPELVAEMSADRPLRVWVAGCSTGEEAYSLAIVCLEALEAAGSAARLQILASDIDPVAVTTARAGFYAKDIEAAVSPERLARFFAPEDGGWRVTSALRDLIVFTVADLLSDPPFSKIDLVSCRNVLIYLGPEAQRHVIASCCFALRLGGLLLLGAAEMPGQSDGCFAIADKQARLWHRVGRSRPGDLHFATARREETSAAIPLPSARRSALADLCRRIVLETYAPAAALLNSRLEILYLLGPTERYLKVTQGHPNPGIAGLLPKALRVRFLAAATACNPANPIVTVSGGRIRGAGDFDIALHAVSAESEPLLLACFIDAPPPRRSAASAGPSSAQEGRTADLESDLEETRGELRDALRDLEQEVEAHGADAAEALSVNEEFQCTNEELLASKEELQSLNEELTALNSQLQETLERQRITANDLKNVLYSSEVATMFLDTDLNIRFYTPAARAIFRVIPTDVGRPIADLAALSPDDAFEADACAVLESSEPIEREIAGVEGRWFLRRIQPYRIEGGQVEGIVVTYVDITERKRTHAALVAAKRTADRATRAKSRFLAAASHDLRQPLQSLALLHGLMGRGKRSAEAARLAALMDQTLHSMTEMLDSLLDVNRIDSGIVRPNLRAVPIAPLMERLAEEFRPLCGEKGLKLRAVPCRAWVRTDPQLLEQMLRNLLSNALKYTPKGGILMGCRRHGAQLSILICDSGIGVADSERTAIFDPYHQVDASSSLSGNGLGLGLSIVQRLSQLMKHPVTVRSAPGRGSAFMISLPVADPDEGAPHEFPTTSELQAPARQTGTILLVEDEDDLRELLAEMLEKEGHTVVARASAQDALAWAGSDVGRPDLLLTDFDVHGGTTGLRLAQDLPDVLGGAVPTIILTGDITTATQQRIAKANFQQITKPVLPEELLARISDLMQTTRAAKAGAVKRAGPAELTVHVVDDDAMIREATRRLFEAEGWSVVTDASAEDFLARPRPDGPACLLVDAILPGMDGLTLLTQLRAEQSNLPAVMLTGHGDVAMAVAALKAGASDLIEKPASAADLLASVRDAIDKSEDDDLQADARKAAQRRFVDLTARERDVLARVLEGAPNKIIAADLGINQRTVENHRAAVMRKTGAASLPALVRLALAAGVANE